LPRRMSPIARFEPGMREMRERVWLSWLLGGFSFVTRLPVQERKKSND
jgi:hypothetical protein